MSRTPLRMAVAVLVSGAALAGVVPETGAQTSVPTLRAGVNKRIGGKAPLLRTAEAAGLAVNPADPRHIVESEVNPRYGFCQFNTSFDGGDTWTTGVLTAPARFGATPCIAFNAVNRLRMDGGIAFGSGQNVYIAFDSRSPDGSDGSSTLVARSTDGGRTFAQAVVVLAGTPGIDPGFGNAAGQQQSYLRPKLGVERRAGGDRVIVAASGTGYNSRSATVAVSDDGAQTWGPGVDAQPAGVTAQYVSNPVVGPEGTIYVSWRTQNSVALGFAADAPEQNWVAHSTDGGQTWSANVQRVLAAPNKEARVNERRLGVDVRDGTLYQVDNETKVVNNADIWLSRSNDKGATWSTPVRVNDDPTSPAVAQSIPNISVAPGGRVDIAWSDRRNSYGGQTNHHDIYMASSGDGGHTFSANRRLTDRSLSLTNGLTTVRSTDFFVPAITPLGPSELMVAWADSRETDFESENMDIYSARVQVNAGGPPPVSRLPLSQPAGLSAALSKLAYPGGAEKFVASANTTGTLAVLVNDGDAAAAVAGSVFARANLGPVLASPSFGLTPDVEAEVKRLAPVGAFLVGDEKALSPVVVSNLIRAGVTATRIFRLAGSDPADTARLVADAYVSIEKAALRAVPDTAVIVDPDSKEAGAAAGMAAALRYPILFAGPDSVPAPTQAAITALGIKSTLVIGGAGVLGAGVMSALPAPTRVAGNELYGTARAVEALAAARGVPTNVAYVADGDRTIDAALLAAPVARLGGMVVLAHQGDPAAAGSVPSRVVVVRSVSEGPLGYRLVASDGGVFAFGGARFLGSTTSLSLTQPIVATASTLGGGGYWMVAADGGVFSFGDASFSGSTGGLKLNRPIVGMAPTPSGRGYFLVAADGGVFSFGDAEFKGSTGAVRLNQPIVGMTATPTGDGYYLVAADGGIFAFGDAVYRGSTGAIRLNRPVVGMALTPSGRGYLLAASDGGIFAFGDAAFRGSAGALTLNRPIIGMATTPGADGYWLIASDGGVFAFGSAPFFGSTASLTLNRPITAAAR